MRSPSFLVASLLLALGLPPASLEAQNYTPTEYIVTVYNVELSTDGTNFVSVLSAPAGTLVDIADPASFTSALGSSVSIPAGTYSWIRMTIDENLGWSHPGAPVSLSNQIFTVSGGPPGPSAGQMSVYFTTHANGGRPNGNGGGQGTLANPFLLGSGATIAANSNTTLRLIFAITDALLDQGGGSYDLGPPEMFFVSENGSASSVSGTFNTVLFNARKVFSSNGMGGYDVDSWDFMSGHGLLTFNGAGAWTWTGTENNLDLQGGGSGAISTGQNVTGRYGVNNDGSIWMTATGEPGTLRGAISSDGTMFVGSMYDSASSHLMVFGVEQASAAGVAAMNSGYYFTTYGADYDTGGSTLNYGANFGIVTGDGVGGVSGTSDSNIANITDPTGTPSITGPTASTGNSFSDTLAINTDGTMGNTSGDLAGGMLESGDAACIAFDFSSTYTERNEFGFIVRQSAANTFTEASLGGTYLGGHFGDVIDGGSSSYFSGFFSVTFDGAGAATVTVVENREGTVTTQTFSQDYTVNTGTGIVTFSDTGGGGGAEMVGAIGPSAMSFLLTAEHNPGGSANDQRFLGLGLKQQ